MRQIKFEIGITLDTCIKQTNVAIITTLMMLLFVPYLYNKYYTTFRKLVMFSYNNIHID